MSLLQDAREFHPRLREASGDDHRLQALPAWEPGMDEGPFLTDLVSELGVSLAMIAQRVIIIVRPAACRRNG